jgi:hypothetical protein
MISSFRRRRRRRRRIVDSYHQHGTTGKIFLHVSKRRIESRIFSSSHVARWCHMRTLEVSRVNQSSAKIPRRRVNLKIHRRESNRQMTTKWKCSSFHFPTIRQGYIYLIDPQGKQKTATITVLPSQVSCVCCLLFR